MSDQQAGRAYGEISRAADEDARDAGGRDPEEDENAHPATAVLTDISANRATAAA